MDNVRHFAVYTFSIARLCLNWLNLTPSRSEVMGNNFKLADMHGHKGCLAGHVILSHWMNDDGKHNEVKGNTIATTTQDLKW